MNIDANSQVVINQNFESLADGENILTLQKGKFNTWGKSTWTVSEDTGKGFNNSNKFAVSGSKASATLVKYKNLEVGETYVFTVAVKVTNTGGQSWKGNYSVKVLSGDKNNTHFYSKEEIKEPKEGQWKEHKIKFTVKEGNENVCFQVYRWKSDVILNVDNFEP